MRKIRGTGDPSAAAARIRIFEVVYGIMSSGGFLVEPWGQILRRRLGIGDTRKDVEWISHIFRVLCRILPSKLHSVALYKGILMCACTSVAGVEVVMLCRIRT